MRICIIIPAHNEELYLKDCLDAFVAQTHLVDELIIVDDHSTDSTNAIATDYAQKYGWIRVLKHESSKEHAPGAKVVQAFDFGLQHVKSYDLLGKFDADIMLPNHYFETMLNHFQSDWKLGMCSGILHIKSENRWVYENIADKNHIRGPIKLYHRACFEKMNGLRIGVGWDTVDVLLAQYHGFRTYVDEDMVVKHLRPTGHGYTQKNHRAKGEAFYKMRYGIVLAKLAALKMAWQARSPKLYIEAIVGYLKATVKRLPRYVTYEEGTFIRKYRWKGIFKKLF
ncbi:glycosyltransferase [Allomuricauda sp. SCSIO 65647]|uniref:glycosyltransferase n=1 Tax=Allomuricauda sp. SCSIO 65647 TaxID=2908843 RepID=UPI001F157D0B|nr:glycosyltransferase family 2 protein [Muricauda sp. SCSIO 65647]UJH66518.1 glycosyltransferase [Muricauda sp. SCSIO 65647]